MKEDKIKSQLKKLRQQAELKAAKPTELKTAPLDAEQMQFIIHELHVHQVELEMQNEELRLSRNQAESLLRKYTDLYEQAPVSFFILDTNGIIQDCNQTASTLWGMDKRFILSRRFQAFVDPTQQDTFYFFLKRIFTTGSMQTLELQMTNHLKEPFMALIEGIKVSDEENPYLSQCRFAVIDISGKKEKEEALRLAKQQKEHLDVVMLIQEQERRRISELLHNSLGQTLYAAKLSLEKMEGLSVENQKLKNTVKTLLKEAIEETRTVSFELAPTILEDFGLPATLEELVNRYGIQSVVFDLQMDGFDHRLVPALELAIYRIVQELLNNAIKHGKAKEIGLFLSLQDNMVIIRVEDDGCGFVPDEALHGRGSGLKNVRNRVQLLQGKFSIDSAIGKGAIVNIKLPLEQA